MENYIMTDQPVTCPKCGSRTEMTEEFIKQELGTQLHRCKNDLCNYKFIEQEDDYFSSAFWKNPH